MRCHWYEIAAIYSCKMPILIRASRLAYAEAVKRCYGIKRFKLQQLFEILWGFLEFKEREYLIASLLRLEWQHVSCMLQLNGTYQSDSCWAHSV